MSDATLGSPCKCGKYYFAEINRKRHRETCPQATAPAKPTPKAGQVWRRTYKNGTYFEHTLTDAQAKLWDGNDPGWALVRDVEEKPAVEPGWAGIQWRSLDANGIHAKNCGCFSCWAGVTRDECAAAPLDANAADVAKEESMKRHSAGCGCWDCNKRSRPSEDANTAKRMVAINDAYRETEQERRHIEAIKAKMAPGVGPMNFGGLTMGWDKRGRR